ncbi:MAG: uroporphyrinogen decarboxylase family protein, partial [Hominenteromicrobium sp.]
MSVMSGKEIIKRIITHQDPPRIGFDFMDGNPCDFIHCASAELVNPKYDRYGAWGRAEAVTRLVPNFSGEVRLTAFGDVYGRFDGKTKGECIRGALQDGWEKLDELEFPVLSEEFDRKMEAMKLWESDKFVLAYLPLAIFSPLRDIRHMENALMDMLLEPENVRAFLHRVVDLNKQAVRKAAKNGADGVIIYDDMGMQHALFFSPACFREVLKPFYRELAEAIHREGMFFFVHSCGLVHDIIDDLIEAGVDVLQFDQPELSGSEVLAREFGSRVTIYSPVDIQKIMPTNDPAVIERGALHMVNSFKQAGGSLIAMDYGNWQDIGVTSESQQIAR